MELMLIKNKNIKLLVNYGLGPILFTWLSWSIWNQLNNRPHLSNVFEQLSLAFSGPSSWKLYTALILVLANWGLEAHKWQILLQPLERPGFLKSFKAILSGVAFSINTPNRIGEYAGRVLYVKEGHRWEAVSLTIIGSLSQLIITLLMGMGGLLFMLNNKTLASATGSYSMWLWALFYGTGLVHLILLLLYFRLGWMMNWLEKIPRTQRFFKHLAVIEKLPVTILLRVLVISAVRYSVFVIQYILLLQLFNVEITSAQAFWLITVMYLVLATIPSIALAEIGIRGKVSILLFGMLSAHTQGILYSAAAIWLMNLILPALAGSLLFLGLKIFSDK
jgi:Lysylphosphatidylglycerol synthase TM region